MVGASGFDSGLGPSIRSALQRRNPRRAGFARRAAVRLLGGTQSAEAEKSEGAQSKTLAGRTPKLSLRADGNAAKRNAERAYEAAWR
jgi:Trm5-related predicted tRNA methylase